MGYERQRESLGWRQRGATVVQVIIVLGVVVVIFLVVEKVLEKSGGFNPNYTVYTPRADDPERLEITAGQQSMVPGVPETYEVTVEFDNPIHDKQGFNVRVEIYEDDLGDVLLDRHVSVNFPAKATVGTGTFVLTCYDADDTDNLPDELAEDIAQKNISGLILVADNNYQTYDAKWEIFPFTPDQTTASYEEGTSYFLTCAKS